MPGLRRRRGKIAALAHFVTARLAQAARLIIW
jgi:hypothetical protein